MEGLSFDNIMDDNEISELSFNQEINETQEETEKNETEENEENKQTNTAEVDPDSLFDDDETPENVGSEEHNEVNEEDTQKTKQKNGSSSDFFSSIATAFAEEGIFPDLDEETIENIKSASDFRDAIKEQMRAELDEQQKRVLDCLDNGMAPDLIRQQEGIIAWIDSQADNIEKEGDAYDNLRRRVILQDYLNRGFRPERAQQKVEKIFEEGTEMEEAKEALLSMKQFHVENYQRLQEEAREQAKKEQEERNLKAGRIKKAILEDKSKLFDDLEISKDIRQAAFDAISKPVYKDPETGDTYTAVQKLEYDNSEEFLAKLGLLYALTDGFKSFNKLVDKKVKKELKHGFSELERKISNTARTSTGSLDFANGVDEESFIGKGIKLDI